MKYSTHFIYIYVLEYPMPTDTIRELLCYGILLSERGCVDCSNSTDLKLLNDITILTKCKLQISSTDWETTSSTFLKNKSNEIVLKSEEEKVATLWFLMQRYNVKDVVNWLFREKKTQILRQYFRPFRIGMQEVDNGTCIYLPTRLGLQYLEYIIQLHFENFQDTHLTRNEILNMKEPRCKLI